MNFTVQWTVRGLSLETQSKEEYPASFCGQLFSRLGRLCNFLAKKKFSEKIRNFQFCLSSKIYTILKLEIATSFFHIIS